MVKGDVVGTGVAVASDGVGETGRTEGVGGGVGLGRTVTVDDGRDVGPGVVCCPPQATAVRITIARQSPSQTTAGRFMLISNLQYPDAQA